MTQHHKHAGPGNPSTPMKPAVATFDSDHNRKLVSDEDIRLCAYQKWEAAGKPTGDGVEFWLEAKQDLEHSSNETSVQLDSMNGHREHERMEAEKPVKDRTVNEDSHYRDNNRMFQSHGERGHRHGGTR